MPKYMSDRMSEHLCQNVSWWGSPEESSYICVLYFLAGLRNQIRTKSVLDLLSLNSSDVAGFHA